MNRMTIRDFWSLSLKSAVALLVAGMIIDVTTLPLIGGIIGAVFLVIAFRWMDRYGGIGPNITLGPGSSWREIIKFTVCMAFIGAVIYSAVLSFLTFIPLAAGSVYTWIYGGLILGETRALIAAFFIGTLAWMYLANVIILVATATWLTRPRGGGFTQPGPY